MKLSFHFQIGFMRFFRRIKPRFARYYAVYHYLRAPFSLMRAYTEQANFIGPSGFAHILKVAVPRYLAQITKTVVLLITVYMVNVLRRPFAGHIRPNQSVRELFSVMYSYGPVPHIMRRPGAFTNKIRPSFMRDPRKKTCLRVITERRAQMFDGAWRLCCHDNAFTIRSA